MRRAIVLAVMLSAVTAMEARDKKSAETVDGPPVSTVKSPGVTIQSAKTEKGELTGYLRNGNVVFTTEWSQTEESKPRAHHQVVWVGKTRIIEVSDASGSIVRVIHAVDGMKITEFTAGEKKRLTVENTETGYFEGFDVTDKGWLVFVGYKVVELDNAKGQVFKVRVRVDK